MQKNTASQKWRVFAFDRTTNEPQTGDAANITAKISKDYGAATATNDVNPTEIEDGYYEFDLTQAETNASDLLILPESITANIVVIGCPARIATTPASWSSDVVQTGDSYAYLGSNLGTLGANATEAGGTGDHLTVLATAANLATVDSVVDAILVDTGTTLPATLTTIEGKVDTVDTVVDAILVDTAEIGAAGAGLTNLPWNASWDAEVQSEVTDGLTAFWTSPATLVDLILDEALSGHNTAGTMGKILKQISEGWVQIEAAVNDASSTTTSFITDLTETRDSFYSDCVLVFIDGNISGQARVITDYNGTTKTVTFDEAFSAAPDDASNFLILTGHTHPVSEFRVEMDSNSTQLAAIVADTNELQTDWANGGRLDVILDELTTQGDTNETKLDTIDTNVDAILVDTGTTIPGTITTVDANVDGIKVVTDALGATAAANLAKSAGNAGIVSFAAEAGTLSTTQATTDLTEATDDHYIGRVIIWLTGNLAGQATDITDYSGATGLLTFTAVTETVVAGDTGIIV